MLGLEIDGLEMRFAGMNAPALSVRHLAIAPGSRVAITGPSGSGKSTFVNAITGLERVVHGTVRWNECNLATLPERKRDQWRGANIGLVMQEFHLFPGLSAMENVLLPARLAGVMSGGLKETALGLLSKVRINRPSQLANGLSRGEMQRVAVARALLRKPGVVVADEPTASLDSESGTLVADLLLELTAINGTTLIAVSHDDRLVQRLDRHLRIQDGVFAPQGERVAAE
ncbi:ATP-binding cassette domain-containing protein [Aureimonas fodinaquatilis]|uniref:ATP-binding cassette domain-containing protein n=1 Tax=Aureimonas fodinaquatilis TaxID=2565783 RepID=A0A5B0DRV7_9HYPH|nr:ATP-binding cassette domain-containing protein [Aureimonas fodinaquatilis]KAA0968481.1 ATP-binding cassette domain-containing protein [Aureimonas fodinaquatilis]